MRALTSIRLWCPFLAFLYVWSGSLNCEITHSEVLLKAGKTSIYQHLSHFWEWICQRFYVSPGQPNYRLSWSPFPRPYCSRVLLSPSFVWGLAQSHWTWFSAAGSEEHQALVWGERLVTHSHSLNWHRCPEAQLHWGPYSKRSLDFHLEIHVNDLQNTDLTSEGFVVQRLEVAYDLWGCFSATGSKRWIDVPVIVSPLKLCSGSVN